MELILHKVCGHPAQQAVTLRRCTPDEAPAVYALQNEVHAAMPHPEWFVTDTLEHITGYITDSLCIGVWQGSRLGAYLTFYYCGQSPHNYAAFLGVPQAEWPHWANVDSAVVHPDWRGNGLQRRMLEAALPLLPESITHLGATVSPANPYSLSNALACGCQPRNLLPLSDLRKLTHFRAKSSPIRLWLLGFRAECCATAPWPRP